MSAADGSLFLFVTVKFLAPPFDLTSPRSCAASVPNSIMLAKPFAIAQLVTAISQLLNAVPPAAPTDKAASVEKKKPRARGGASLIAVGRQFKPNRSLR